MEQATTCGYKRGDLLKLKGDNKRKKNIIIIFIVFLILGIYPQEARAKGEKDWRKNFKGIAFWHGDPKKKEVALTFDDGPYPVYSQQILDVLKKYEVKAAFFVIGQNVRKYPWVVKRMAKEGHTIGNHTWTHRSIINRSGGWAQGEIGKTHQEILKVSKESAYFFRPPYGQFSAKFFEVVEDYHYIVTFWSVDPSDYRRPGAKTIAYRVLNWVKPGSIIVLHDGGGNRSQTVKALPIIIEGLKKKGYKMVTLSQMFTLNNAVIK